MAKYERKLVGNFYELLNWLHNDIIRGSVSASYEDGSDIDMGNVKIAVRVYERYSMIGGNRVSLNVVIAGNGQNLHVTSITAGGSKAVFFKINTLGENAFLDVCRNSVEAYISRNPQT
jgi:hypothetical protein